MGWGPPKNLLAIGLADPFANYVESHWPISMAPSYYPSAEQPVRL